MGAKRGKGEKAKRETKREKVITMTSLIGNNSKKIDRFSSFLFPFSPLCRFPQDYCRKKTLATHKR
jgi:hypothetical protein